MLAQQQFRPARRRLLAGALITTLGLGLAQLPVAGAAAAAGGRSRPVVPAERPPARGHALTPEKPGPDPTAARTMTRPDPVSWPASGSADLTVAATGTARAKIGGLPVAVRAGGATASRRVRMQVLDRTVAQRAGADGPVVRLDAAGAGPVTVSIGYETYAHAIGGDWGARLRLVQLPGCALSTPDQAGCRRAMPLASQNDPAARTVTATVATASSGAVLALAAGASSAQGDYTATKLASSSSWQTTLSSGAFGWSYPIRLPSTANGFSPSVGLAYSSQAVDGRTSATNNQGSWIGEGFGYEPGYIERRYKPCHDDGHKTSGDQCWATWNATIMLDGRSGSLVRIDNDHWKLSDDDGSKVERFTGPANGDDDGEFWKVTTTDGTQYFFGRNRLPGWADKKETTDSVWSLPVYGDDDNEPCHGDTFAESQCDQGWRWNLDYVIDPHGNAVSYFYDRETNAYARNGKTDVDGTEYDRGGYLARIDYGQRDGDVYATPAPARVVFGTTERCIPTAAVDCDAKDLSEKTAASWPDVPQDRICAPGTHCKDTQTAPTFFTRKRLISVQTEIRQGTGWSPVESWTLQHTFKANDDNSRTLWLTKLVHNGLRGTATALPAIEFEGIQLPNRIVKDNDNLGGLIRYRLATVTSDSGAKITINYKAPDCTKDNLPKEGESVRRCFPVKWNKLGGGDDDQVTDWFHKYVVDNVVTDDLVGGNDDMVASYQYVGDAAWRKADPDGITKSEDLTWSSWRGYDQVIVRTGDGQSMPTRNDHFFMRGLSGGKRSDGTAPAVSVTDSTGRSYTDYDELAGHEYEAIVYDGKSIVSKTINEPWRLVTRTKTESWGEQRSTMTGNGTARKLTALPADAQGKPRWMETKLVTRRDTTWGRTIEMDDFGDVSTAADDKCTRTWYADNADRYLYASVSRVQSVAVACAEDKPDLAAQLLSDIRTSYDGLAWNKPPTAGTATRTETLDRYDGSTIKYLTSSETLDFDTYGRPKSVRNALGYVSTTEYTDTAGLTTQIKTTNAALHDSTRTLDPAFGVPTRIIDPNSRRTDLEYDSLGRLLKVWLPDQDRDQGAAPNLKFGYNYRNSRPTVVTTERLRNDGGYRASYELMDGLLRTRQTQTPGPDGGWLLTDTFYNGAGQGYKTNDPYLALGAAGDLPIVTAEGQVNGQMTTEYDGAARPIRATFSVSGDARWATTTRYEGNRTSIDPPDGGTPTTVVVDGQGHTTELWQYHGASPVGDADITRYSYTSAGSLATVTDPGGNLWRYFYDQRNQRIRTEDPDAGATTSDYDALGQLSWTKDNRGQKLSYVYDGIGRKTEEWLGDAGTGVKQAAWVFDAPGYKGQLYYSQRSTGGQDYRTIILQRDQLYRPTSTRYSFPSGGVGTQLGKSYDFSTAYNTDGTVQSTGMPAAGTLPAESIATTYDDLLRPTTLTGSTSYVTSTSYSSTGELLQAEMYTGGSGKKAWLTYGYERGSGRMITTKLDRQGALAGDLNATYRYDQAGDVISVADTPVGAPADVQCFDYDHRQRLTEAWAAGDATADCTAGPDVTGIGGPAPYHQSWTFDAAGNRDLETIHSTTGGADTVRDYIYPPSGPDAVRPHAVTRVEETGPTGARTLRYGYDSSGNTVCRPGVAGAGNCESPDPAGRQTLTWDGEGHLATSATTGGPATTYIYDADGSRIARKDTGGTTLFLPGMEVAVVGAALSAIRYVAFGGRTVAVRSTNGVLFQAGDNHNTAVATISAATGAIAWRRTTPYGGGREATSPAFWPDSRGFLGGTQDGTGLTHLGAREYDPALGAFVSVDPLIDTNNPNALGGYSYAENNPVTKDDPSGEMFPPEDRVVMGGGGGSGGGKHGGGGSGGGGGGPLSNPKPGVYVDQNGVAHYEQRSQNVSKEQGTASFLNRRLQDAGEYFAGGQGSGSRYILQDENNADMIKARGTITLPNGEVTVAGTTADAIKVSWINGKIVSVDSYDFTGGAIGREAEHVKTADNKMRTDSGRGAKQQTQNVVLVAETDEQAEAMRQQLGGRSNIRIVNPSSGYDTGEMYSKTHSVAMESLRTPGVAPRTPTGQGKGGTGGKTGRGGGTARGMGALGVFGDLIAAHEFGKAMSSDDPYARAQFMCDFTGVPAYCAAAQPPQFLS